MKRFSTSTAYLIIVLVLASGASAQSDVRNVILITLDGVRTQEMFAGLDARIQGQEKAIVPMARNGRTLTS